MSMRNERDWRSIDRQRRADDWRYAGEFMMRPFEVIGGAIVMSAMLAFVAAIVVGAVLIRMAPLIVAVFAAIILARCTGVI